MNNKENIILGDYDLSIVERDGSVSFYEAFTWYTDLNKPGKFFSVYSGKEL